MTLFLDARLPLRFASVVEAGSASAVLVEGDLPAPVGVPTARFRLNRTSAHAPGCGCCAARGPVAEALSELFLARARGEVTFFRSVLAVVSNAEARAAVLAALASDPVTAGRFRLA